MSFPNNVTPGVPMKAQWANDVVSILKSGHHTNVPKHVAGNMLVNPFDVISLEQKADTFWYIKIEKGLYYETENIEPTDIKVNAANDVLSDYPEIKVEANKDLYFCFKEKKLVWDSASINGNLKILKFVYDASEFEIENVHPQNIDLRFYPPFQTLYSKLSGDYYAALTPGYVVERSAINSNAITLHTPLNLKTGSELIHHPITEAQQIALKVLQDNHGTIVPSVSVVIESIDPFSIHYYPACADGSGQDGAYHYKMGSLETTFKDFLAGSHVDHFAEIPQIQNTTLSLSANIARPVMSYDPTLNKFNVRSLTTTATSQLSVIESGDFMKICGNSLSGSLVYKVGDNSNEQLTTWDDGLHTVSGEKIIPIPELIAGANISITELNNTFTISASSTSLSTTPLSGLNGYWTYVRENFYTNAIAILYVKMEDGRMTQIQDDFTSGAPSGWGSLIKTLYFLEGAGYGSSSTTW